MTNTPVADLVRNALDFANRATGDEDWDTLSDRIADAMTEESKVK